MTSGASFYVLRESATVAHLVAAYGMQDEEAKRAFGEMLLDVGWDFIFNNPPAELAAIAYFDYRE